MFRVWEECSDAAQRTNYFCLDRAISQDSLIKNAPLGRYPEKTLPNICIGIEGRGAVAAPNAGIFFLRDHLGRFGGLFRGQIILQWRYVLLAPPGSKAGSVAQR
jgi:hypothetical protein